MSLSLLFGAAGFESIVQSSSFFYKEEGGLRLLQELSLGS